MLDHDLVSRRPCLPRAHRGCGRSSSTWRAVGLDAGGLAVPDRVGLARCPARTLRIGPYRIRLPPGMDPEPAAGESRSAVPALPAGNPLLSRRPNSKRAAPGAPRVREPVVGTFGLADEPGHGGARQLGRGAGCGSMTRTSRSTTASCCGPPRACGLSTFWAETESRSTANRSGMRRSVKGTSSGWAASSCGRRSADRSARPTRQPLGRRHQLRQCLRRCRSDCPCREPGAPALRRSTGDTDPVHRSIQTALGLPRGQRANPASVPLPRSIRTSRALAMLLNHFGQMFGQMQQRHDQFQQQMMMMMQMFTACTASRWA